MNSLTKLHPGLFAIRSRKDLLDIIHDRLYDVFPFCGVTILLQDDDGETQRNFVHYDRVKGYAPEDADRITHSLYPVKDGFFDVTLESPLPVYWNLSGLLRRKDVPDYLSAFGAGAIRWIMGLSLRVDEKAMGCMFFVSDEPFVVADNDAEGLETLRAVADQLSFAVANILAHEQLLEREKEKSILLAISNEIATIRYKPDLNKLVNEKLKRLLPVSHVLTGLVSDDRQWYSAFMLDSQSASKNHPDYAKVTTVRYPVADGILEQVLSSDQPLVYDLDELMWRPSVPAYLKMNYECGIREAVFCALGDPAHRTGVMIIFSATPNLFRSHHLGLIKGIASQLSTAIANILANEKIEQQLEEISRYKQQLEIEKRYLQEEIQTAHNEGEIIGSSPAMRKVFELVSKVAETATTVLLMGETGTGKELIARALHASSPRRDKLMVKVNCAALPANLIESELFGHERGSFTGATDRKIGKFELANNSTLFLDEIGELPLDLQTKLLRALQEKEIERVGGRGVIHTDVRIIAATNRDLQKEVETGNFRSDLFYRLNVFPITIPPLRQRREDIGNLATHFLHKYAKKGKGPMNFSSKVLKELTAYNWPGNVRELEHLVERSILLNTGVTITSVHLPVTEREELKQLLPDAYIKTIAEVEREHIISVLKICNGKVAGIGGAAEKLRIPSTTLTSKIRRLKIRKGYLDE